MGETAGLCLAGTMLHWPMLAELDVDGNCLCSTSLFLMAKTLSANESTHKRMLFIRNAIVHASTEEIQEILETQKEHSRVMHAPYAKPAKSRA
jgi:hypothetical protein